MQIYNTRMSSKFQNIRGILTKFPNQAKNVYKDEQRQIIFVLPSLIEDS